MVKNVISVGTRSGEETENGKIEIIEETEEEEKYLCGLGELK